jgi:hypothetical protein
MAIRLTSVVCWIELLRLGKTLTYGDPRIPCVWLHNRSNDIQGTASSRWPRPEYSLFAEVSSGTALVLCCVYRWGSYRVGVYNDTVAVKYLGEPDIHKSE